MSVSFAKRLGVIAPSATLAMNARATQLREAGHKIYAFGVGEPDFSTPSFISEAAHQAALRGDTHYTAVTGTASLKKAICTATERDRGWKPAPNQVTVSVGAKHALFNLAMALYEPGDEVLIPTPYWVSYPEQVRMFGAEPVFVSTREEDGWRLTPQALEAAVTSRTKALILCTPSNPTGSAYGEAELRALGEVLKKHNFWILVDEIYGDLVYDTFQHHSLAALFPELHERLVIVDGVSKTYAMTGWRIGWSLSPPALAKALDTVQSQSTSNPSSISQAAAEAALLGPRDPVLAMRDAFERRRDVMVEGLRSIPGVRCRMPEGAFYAFADFRGLLGKRWSGGALTTDEDIASFLLSEAHVATVAGTPFGAPGYIRCSYAVSEEDIRNGIAAITNAVRSLY